MSTYTRPTERIRRYGGITVVALTLILAPAGAALDAPDLVYDATAGLSSAYTGDLGDLGDVVVCFAFTFAIEDDNGERVTLEDYLMSGGPGGLPVEIETWELRVPSAGCLGDLDGDGQVDQADLGSLLAAYHINDSGDLNCDGATEQEDLAIFLANYGMTCP